MTTPDPTGRTFWVTDGPTWCRRLATLMPPARGHTTRFHGVLASAHKWRAAVVPVPTPEPTTNTTPSAMTLARRLDWAALLRRVWGPVANQYVAETTPMADASVPIDMAMVDIDAAPDAPPVMPTYLAEAHANAGGGASLT